MINGAGMTILFEVPPPHPYQPLALFRGETRIECAKPVNDQLPPPLCLVGILDNKASNSAYVDDHETSIARAQSDTAIGAKVNHPRPPRRIERRIRPDPLTSWVSPVH